jgi:hypothetical protein
MAGMLLYILSEVYPLLPELATTSMATLQWLNISDLWNNARPSSLGFGRFSPSLLIAAFLCLLLQSEVDRQFLRSERAHAV